MGIIRSSFSFILGTVCGIYIAQSYKIPNMEKVAKDLLHRLKEVEEKRRKKPGDEV